MKKIIMMVTVAFLFIFLVYQGSMAFFHAETEVGAKISAGKLGINLIENSTHENATKIEGGYRYSKIMPGAMLDNTAYIENAKDNTLYVRVTAEKFWINKDGEKLSDLDASFIELYTKNPSDWIIIDDAENSNSEIMYFYYKYPIVSGEKTSNVLDSIQISSDLTDKDYRDLQIHLQLFADAVQSYAAQDAVLAEWGIEFELDENGTIISIDE